MPTEMPDEQIKQASALQSSIKTTAQLCGSNTALVADTTVVARNRYTSMHDCARLRTSPNEPYTSVIRIAQGWQKVYLGIDCGTSSAMLCVLKSWESSISETGSVPLLRPSLRPLFRLGLRLLSPPMESSLKPRGGVTVTLAWASDRTCLMSLRGRRVCRAIPFRCWGLTDPVTSLGRAPSVGVMP